MVKSDIALVSERETQGKREGEMNRKISCLPLCLFVSLSQLPSFPNRCAQGAQA